MAAAMANPATARGPPARSRIQGGSRMARPAGADRAICDVDPVTGRSRTGFVSSMLGRNGYQDEHPFWSGTYPVPSIRWATAICAAGDTSEPPPLAYQLAALIPSESGYWGLA